MEKRRIVASSKDKNKRVDAFLANRLVDFSRTQIKNWMSQGLVSLDGKLADPSCRVKGNEEFVISIPDLRPTELEAEDLPLDVLFEDADIIVVNKPAGMVVHPAAGNWDGTLVNALLHHFPDVHVGGTQRPGIVHRLDKETSGVMVVARNDKTHRSLTNQFQRRTVEKQYRAFCFGAFKKPEFELKTGHQRHEKDRKKFTTRINPSVGLNPRVRVAHSFFQVVQSCFGISELVVKIYTGRTHQIRAQLADIGHPILQDALYGGKKAVKRLPDSPVYQLLGEIHRHTLHAEALKICHPSKNEWMMFTAPLPMDLLNLQNVLRGSNNR